MGEDGGFSPQCKYRKDSICVFENQEQVTVSLFLFLSLRGKLIRGYKCNRDRDRSEIVETCPVKMAWKIVRNINP